jgi:RNA polymerase sigma-70 factor (ECF subfamily)
MAELESNRSWLETVIRSRLVDWHATDDLLQELAISVMRQTNRPSEPEKVAPWLYRIALRKIINHRRFQGRQRGLLDRYATRVQGSQREQNTIAEHWLLRKEDQSHLRQSLERIPRSDREILLLKYSENWSYRELADRLGVTVKTIEYRLLRARDALREQLNQSYEDEPD